MNFRPGRPLIAAAALASLLVSGCGGTRASSGRDADGRIRVVATTGMIGDIALRIGGDRVRVRSLMGPGVDPHLYKATAGDVGRLAEAGIIFYNGLHLEAAMGEVLEEMNGRVRTVAVTDSIPRDTLLAPPEFKGAYDPHVWFDVQLWSRAAERVAGALAAHDTAGAAVYRANAVRYRAELDSLHQWVLARAREVPAERRVLVTAHDAFNYFGRAYGFEVRGLQGISTAAEAGTADVQGLAQFIAERGLPAIFVESSIAPRTVEAVQQAVLARGAQVAIGGSLFSDAMGTAGTPEASYVGMVRHNVNTIVNALKRAPGAAPVAAEASR